jgi:2-methylcitrate dehydratase PrpD
MAALSSTKAIRNWMYSTSFEDIPPDVRHTTLLALYDDIGCNLACSLIPVAHRMVDFVKLVGGPPDCSIMGFPLRTSVLNAALVNGTVGHGDEIDATDDTGQPRTLPAVIAAALAAGQFAGASGQEVVRAVVLGHELSNRIHAVQAWAQRDTEMASGPIDLGHSMGSAAAAGISLGLPPDRMEVALSLAATMVCDITPPIDRETEHMVKSFMRGGVGARNGVAAALMAKAGYDAPRDIFDGPQGFFHSRLGVEEPGPEFLRGLGEEYSIRGTRFKRASAGGPNQGARLALVEIIAENGIAAGDIAEILVKVRPGGFNTITTVPHPTIYARDVLALAAVYGGIGFREAHQEICYKSPEVLSLRERIKVEAGLDSTRGGDERYRGAVTVITKDGRKLQKESLWRRKTEEELDAKFSYLVGLRAGEAKAKELARVLKRLDTVSNVAEVMVQLELPEASIDEV